MSSQRREPHVRFQATAPFRRRQSSRSASSRQGELSTFKPGASQETPVPQGIGVFVFPENSQDQGEKQASFQIQPSKSSNSAQNPQISFKTRELTGMSVDIPLSYCQQGG